MTGERAKQFTLSIGKALTESNESSINNFDKVINTEAQLVEGAKLVDQLGKLLNSPKKGFLLRTVTKFDDQVVESLKKIVAHRKMANDYESELKQRSIEIDQIHEKLLAVRQQLSESIVQFKKWQHLLDLALRDNRLSSEQLKEVSRIRSIYMTSLETLNHQKQFTEDSINHNREAKERILKSAEKNSYFLRNTIAEFIKTYRLDLLEVASRSKKQMVEIVYTREFDVNYYGSLKYDYNFIKKVEFVKKTNASDVIIMDETKKKFSYKSKLLVTRAKFGESLMENSLNENVAVGDMGYDLTLSNFSRPYITLDGVAMAKLNNETGFFVQYPTKNVLNMYKYIQTEVNENKYMLLKVSEALDLFSNQSINTHKNEDLNIISIASKLKNPAKAYHESKHFLTKLLASSPINYIALIRFLIRKTNPSSVYRGKLSNGTKLTIDFGINLNGVTWGPYKKSPYYPIEEIGLLLEAIDTIESHRSDLNLQNLNNFNLNEDLRETVEIILELKTIIANEEEKNLQEREDNNDIFHLLK